MNSFRRSLALATLFFLIVANAGAWTSNTQELDIASRMSQASGQRRAVLQFDPILAQVARERAEDMATRRYFDHINPDGHGANYLVRRAGYILPDWYPNDGNNLESIAGGGSTSGITWSDWMGSPDHKKHLLGEIEFFAEQTSYGIGFYQDPGSQYRYYWVVLTAPPMQRSATLSIVSPAEGTFIPEGPVSVRGTTGGAQVASAVQISIENAQGTSAWANVTGTQDWSSTLNNVVPGANTLRARSLSSAGTVLDMTTRTFQYVVVRPLTIRVAGQGTVNQFVGTTSRRVGVTYAITAAPAPGWLFAGWSGSWTGTQATVRIEMREGLDATATFVPNPFLARRGMYSGLIGESSTRHDERGSVRLRLNAFGKVSGQVFFAGKGYSFLEQFRINGRATIRLPRRDAPPLLLVLDLNEEDGNVSGAIIDGPTTNSFAVARARQAGAFLTALAGAYTVSFPASRANPDESVPQGDGYGVLRVDESGAAVLSAALADGSVFSRGGWIAENGELDFYTPLYSGGGELSGTLTFNDAASGDLNGTLIWKRPRTTNSARFSQGFDTTISTVGTRYTPPDASFPMLNVSSGDPNARLILGGGDLAAEASQPVRLGAGNAIGIPNRQLPGMTAAINAKNGTFSGTFTHPVSGGATRFRGVFLQKQNVGAGFFLGVNQSGYASLTPAP